MKTAQNASDTKAKHEAHQRMLKEHEQRKQWKEDDKRRRSLLGKPRRGCLTALVH